MKTCRKLKNNGNEYLENCHSSCTENAEWLVENIKSSTSLDNSLELNNISCVSELHRSHSLNCSYGSLDISKTTDASFSVRHCRKSIANHHRTVNYHFRPSTSNRLSSSKIHCSCLVLSKDSDLNIKEVSLTDRKLSTSLPNLETSFESDSGCRKYLFSSSSNEISCSDILLNTSNTNINNIVDNLEHYPVINNDHIIRICV